MNQINRNLKKEMEPAANQDSTVFKEGTIIFNQQLNVRRLQQKSSNLLRLSLAKESAIIALGAILVN